MDEPVFGRDRSGLHGLSTSSSTHNNSLNMDGSLMSKDDKHTLHGLLINMHTCLSEHAGVNALFQLTSSLYTADITQNSTASAAAVSRATAMLSKKIHATTSDTDRRKWHDVTRMEMLVKLFYQSPSDSSSIYHSSAASLKRSIQPYDIIPSCTCYIHPTSCPIRLYRCFFAVRGPDNLIRMLKHIISTTAIINELDPNDVIQEWTWKMIWRCDQILRSGVLDTCDGPLTLSEKAKEKQHFMPWWSGGMLQKVLKIIAKLGPFSESVINVFVEILTGDLILPEDVTTNGTSRNPKSSPPTRTTTTTTTSQSRFKIKPIVESGILPALLFALSATSPALCKSGLEYLNVLLIRHPENARHFLMENQWQQWIVPLLTDVGGPPAGVSISGIIGPHSVFRPLQKQSNTVSGVSSVLDDDGDSSLSQESKLAMNLMVCILYYQFSCDHMIDDVHDENMFKVLIESVDLIEDMNGWNVQTVGLIRLMFSSLTSKISSNLNNRNSFRHESLHRSWDCLFDYLACVEDFIFYSPLQTSSTTSTPSNNRSPAHTPTHSPTAATRTLSHMTLDDKQHSLTSGSSSGSMQGTPAKAARPQEARHFKTVGLHTNATGTSDDIQLVEKVVSLLDGLKIQEVSATPDVYQDLAEREKVKKTKKRVQAEIAFFKETAGYLRNSNTLKFRESPQSQVNHMIKNITNALESRKRLRGEVSGVFHNLTRSKRLRSLESKLSGQSEKGNTATVTKTKDRVELGVEKFDLRSKLERARRAFRNPKSAKDYYESRSMAIDSTPLPQNNQPPPATRERGTVTQLPKKLSSNDLNAMKNDIPKKTSHPSASSPTATPLAIIGMTSSATSTSTSTSTSTAPPSRPAMHLVIKAPTHAPPPPPTTDDDTPPSRHATPPLHSSAHNSPRHASPQRFTPPIHSSIPSPPIGGNFSSGFPSPMMKSNTGTTPPSIHMSPLKTSTSSSSSSSLDDTSVTCTHCHIPLQDSFEYEGRPYCERDFARLFCSCGICGHIVENDQPYVRLVLSTSTTTRTSSEKQLYHIKCLTCTHCSRPLGNTDDDDELLDMLDLDQDRKGVYQHDNKVYCRVDYYALFGARCPYCSQLVTGEKLEALGESWHPHHFICAGPCGRSLENRDFYMVPDKKNSTAASTQANSFKITKDTNLSSLQTRNHTNGRESYADKTNLRPFCEKCFLSQYKLCSGCGETVNSDHDGIQVAMGDKKLPYHHHCYVCNVCTSGISSPATTPRGNDGKVGARFGGGLSTSIKLLFGPDEKLYCQDHFIHKFASLCPACQHRVIDDDVCVVNEHEYHVNCVTCIVCNISLTTTGQQVFVKEDIDGNVKLYCRTHYQDLLTPVVDKGPTCKRCSKALTGDCVVISGYNYHSSCVLCSVCDKPLSVPLGGDGKIYSQTADELRGKDESQHGLIYCHEHYLSLFAASCPQCEKYVTGGQVLKMKNQKYHASCFHCITCSTPFTATSKFGVNPTTHKIYCPQHYQ